MKRNTAKEKMKRNKEFPYKYRRKCLKCGSLYGSDHKRDNRECPKCITKKMLNHRNLNFHRKSR